MLRLKLGSNRMAHISTVEPFLGPSAYAEQSALTTTQQRCFCRVMVSSSLGPISPFLTPASEGDYNGPYKKSSKAATCGMPNRQRPTMFAIPRLKSITFSALSLLAHAPAGSADLAGIRNVFAL
jgi:hypothetical protein